MARCGPTTNLWIACATSIPRPRTPWIVSYPASSKYTAAKPKTMMFPSSSSAGKPSAPRMPSSAQLPRRLSLEARNTIPEIAVAIDRSVEFLRKNGVSRHVLFVSELALEELLTNIVKYGYKDSAPHAIAVELEAKGDVVMLRLADDGTAFNPW